MTEETHVFLTCVRSPDDLPLARLLIESLRDFGGELARSEFWVFATRPGREDGGSLAAPGVRVVPLSVPEHAERWPYGDKALACAEAERMSSADVRSLIWLDLECLIVQPPALLALDAGHGAALRPVHIRNIGSPAGEPPDAFWRGVFEAVGVADVATTVRTFIGGESVRAYYNSHCFAVRPDLGLFTRWSNLYQGLIGDERFVRDACTDIRHPIFLFQAVFSTIVAVSVPSERVRILPPTYNYPYNLHRQVPPADRAAVLNDLVCFTFEGRDLRPGAIRDIGVREPLRSWLAERAELLASAAPTFGSSDSEETLHGSK